MANSDELENFLVPKPIQWLGVSAVPAPSWDLFDPGHARSRGEKGLVVKYDATGAAEPRMLLAGRASHLMANIPVRICYFRGKLMSMVGWD